MLTPAQAKQIKGMPEWEHFEEHLRECVQALNAVSDIPDNADYERVSRGRQYAIELIKAILAPFDIEDITEEDARAETFKKLGIELPRKNTG